MYDNLTVNDIRKMREETEHRKSAVRRKALETVREAKAHGDLSENSKHKVAKQDKNRNESRTRYLEKMIKTAGIISSNSREGEVGLGDIAEVYIPDDDEMEHYRPVTTVRDNFLQGLTSTDSPLDKIIRDRKIGDKVYVKVDGHFGYGVEARSIDKAAENDEDKLRSH